VIKKLTFLMLLLCISFQFLPATASAAAGDIKLTTTSTTIDFPAMLAFNIGVQSSSSISRIRLRYEVDKQSYAPAFAESWPDFKPGNNVSARWIWDMRKSSLPPGAKITYWWVIDDSAGNRLTSSREIIYFDDTRYKWQKISEGKVTLNWYQGSNSFAQDLLKAATEAIERQGRDTGTYLENPVNLYIYGNYRDLRGSLVATEEWTGGVAYAGFNIISIGIAPNNLDWGKKAVAHEMGHLVTHQITFSPYGANLPPWLDEGLAMHAEGEQGKSTHDELVNAIKKDNVYTLKSLSSPFSANAEEAYFSYAQSQSTVEYLINEFGGNSLHKLLILMRDGSTMDAAVLQVYGFDLNGLDKAWMNYMLASTAVN
jgi:hypothetical protein